MKSLLSLDNRNEIKYIFDNTGYWTFTYNNVKFDLEKYKYGVKKPKNEVDWTLCKDVWYEIFSFLGILRLYWIRQADKLYYNLVNDYIKSTNFFNPRGNNLSKIKK
jgi:hypothetical protein